MLITNQTFEDVRDLETAKYVAETLNTYYPGYMWAVEINDHCPLIRLLDAPVRGYCCLINRKDIYSASNFKDFIMRLGGEMLERCGVRRGAKKEDDYRIRNVEGAEERFYIAPKSIRNKWE